MQSLNRLKSERPRKAYDFYETPHELCRASLIQLFLDESTLPFEVLDVGCGNGVWGAILRESYNKSDSERLWIDGVDIQEMNENSSYTRFIQGDFLELAFAGYELIMGNPPYSLAEEFIRRSHDILMPSGHCFFLLRLAFLESKKRHFGLFTDYPPKRVYVLSRRPSFFTTKDGSRTVDALAYAMFLWQKGWEGKTELDWLYWEYDK
jgi:SAM-dependent methyltransferase